MCICIYKCICSWVGKLCSSWQAFVVVFTVASQHIKIACAQVKGRFSELKVGEGERGLTSRGRCIAQVRKMSSDKQKPLTFNLAQTKRQRCCCCQFLFCLTVLNVALAIVFIYFWCGLQRLLGKTISDLQFSWGFVQL